MRPKECVICGKPCSRKNGDHWHLCKECNDKYWTPHKDDYTYSSFLDTIEYFKDDYKNEQDNFWKELGLDDSEDNSNDGLNKLQHTSTLDKR
jgi:hypothetical protein